MELKDFRDRLVPHLVFKRRSKKIEEYDLISIPTSEFDNEIEFEIQLEDEGREPTRDELIMLNTNRALRIKAISTHALLNGVREDKDTQTLDGRNTASIFLNVNDEWTREVTIMDSNGGPERVLPSFEEVAIAPYMQYRPLDEEIPKLNIREVKGTIKVKDEDIEISYHTANVGGYRGRVMDEETSKKLEDLYNGGMLKDGLTNTGRWISSSGDTHYSYDDDKYEDVTMCGYKGKHEPIFEYNGETYIRCCSFNSKWEDRTYIDDDLYGYADEPIITWMKEESIPCMIKNWDDLNVDINPEGAGKTDVLELVVDEAILGGIPFFSNAYNREYKVTYIESTIRNYLNGRDGNAGDFSGQCNFLNEAFNLTREPMIEYSIPENERRIPDWAYNGCTTLKKLEIHQNVTSIGRKAFEGVNFKYAYRAKNGKLVLAEELPKNKDEYSHIVDLEKATEVFSGFDYEILLGENGVEETADSLQHLQSKGVTIPNEYAKELLKNGKLKEFAESCDFTWFKTECSEIYNDILRYCPDSRVNIYTLAANLGCFSSKKVLDKDGNETEEYLAPKACKIMAQIVREYKINFHENEEFFKYIPVIPTDVNQDFIEYLEDPNNLNFLTDLEKDEPYLFSEMMSDFDSFRSSLEKTDLDGMEDSIEEEKAKIQRIISTNKNLDLEDAIMLIKRLKKQARTNNAPEHILGKPIKESPIIAEIDQIRMDTQEELKQANGLALEIPNKIFTYEWLSKNDPENALLCLVWGRREGVNEIDSSDFYTGDKVSIFAPDVQTLAIRNEEEKIVGKIVMYVNKELGFALVRDEDVPDEYKDDRTEIFEAIKRGIDAFRKEYDEQNPNNPLKQINLAHIPGFSGLDFSYVLTKRFAPLEYMRLKQNPKEFPVPDEYGFKSKGYQEEEYFLLYKRPEDVEEAKEDKGVEM